MQAGESVQQGPLCYEPLHAAAHKAGTCSYRRRAPSWPLAGLPKASTSLGLLHRSMARRNVAAPGASSSTADAAAVPFADQTTDYARWRLRDDRGTHTWHYLETDADVAAWPQTTADKYFLGLDLVRGGPAASFPCIFH